MWIRTAGERDLPTIHALLVETWHDTYDAIYGVEKVSEINDTWHTLDRLRERLTQPGTEFIVADNGEKICGVAFASTDDGKLIQLHQLYVSPLVQGQGAGKLLLEEIAMCFPDMRCIRLEVEESNSSAVAFYAHLGFAEAGRTENCGAPDSGLPALVLEKHFS